MKPLRIEIENFGPYTSHVVDLAPFRDEGLFLVHGDTGAGKSTLLDAIAYALYGRGLGVRDRDEFLRNTAAPPDLPTAVTLTFTLGEREFRVRRSMEHERAARRGGGTARQRAEAVLECTAGDAGFATVSSPRKVDEAIEQLLRLPFEQFARIIVLPQGEFRDLLLAKAEDRERLLEKIFGTEIFTGIETALRELERQREREARDLRARVDSLLASAAVADRAALAATVAEAGERAAEAGERAATTEEALAAARAAHDDARGREARNARRAELREAIGVSEAGAAAIRAAQAEAALAERAELCHAALALAAERREVLARAGAAARQAQDEARAAEGELADPTLGPAREADLTDVRDRSRDRRQRLDHHRETLNVLETDDRALARARADLATARAERDAVEARAVEAREQRRLRVEAVEALRQQTQGEVAARLQKQEIEQRRDALRRRTELDDQLRNAERALRERERRLRVAREREAEAGAARDALRRRERETLAAQLALALTAGSPCPVCGSIEHPGPAGEVEVVVGEAEVRAAEAAYETAREQAQEHDRQRAQLGGELDAHRRQRDALVEADPADEAQLDEAWERARRSLADIETARVAARRAERAVAESDEALRALGDALRETERRAEKAGAAEAQLEPRVRATRAALEREGVRREGFAGELAAAEAREQEAERELVALRRRRSAGEARRAGASERAARAQRDAAEASARAGEAERALEEALAAHGFDGEAPVRAGRRTDVERRRLRELCAAHAAERRQAVEALGALGDDETVARAADEFVREVTAAGEALRAAREAVGAWHQRHADRARLLEQVDGLAAGVAQAEQDHATTRRVADMANGRNEAKVRLSRYVLLAQFDRVAECASARLEAMSDGRFRLRRRENRQKGGEFDLVVDDAYTGAAERSVATLSGGEMFMASLAMALGLSDVVQQYAGGVRLEALFVDEGFGSLDEEALDKAVAMLEALQESRRLVGVVSHVPELRKRIPARLEVVRTDEGSVTRATVRARSRTAPER